MKLFNAFSMQAPNKVFLSILLGGLSGISYALLIPIVLSAITSDGNSVVETESSIRTILSFEVANYKVATIFLVVCMFILLTRTLSQVILTRISIDMTTELRINLYQRILAAPIDVLESMGPSKLLATITTDVGRIVSGARMLPDLLINAVTIIGMLGFLIYLNIDVFWFVIGAIAFGVVTYQVPMLLSNIHFSHSRKKVDDLLESINGLIYGAKELKLNDVKSRFYLERVLKETEHEVRDADKTGNTIVRAAANYGDMISFFVIGIITFIFVNYEAMSNDELVGVVMALLYITGPVSIVINSIPQIMLSKVSLNKVNKIFKEIPSEDINQELFPLELWQTIRFSNVCYQYKAHNGVDGFKVGPLDFTIEKGAITFIVGGNGSGKSTLSKLLTLHHRPTDGVISFGNTVIDNYSVKSARQTISSIYSDYYLFNRLLNDNDMDGGNVSQQKDEIDIYLQELGLESKVDIQNGRFSTLSLSDGQKRRLALLVAFLEDKECYLFDEWAADQDPVFKEFFYYRILPKLKAKGKAVVVISHDDRYFSVADKVLVMENGILVDCITEHHEIKDKTRVRNIVSSTETSDLQL